MKVLQAVVIILASVCTPAFAESPVLDADLGIGQKLAGRLDAQRSSGSANINRLVAMTPAERRAAVDEVWGPGFPAAVQLEMFDKFWSYVDSKFAAFQGIHVDWKALRDRYRPEVAGGVSRGRFAAIINHMSLALRDGHTIPMDLLVNVFTFPDRGVPLFGVGAWIADPSGACMTAQDDGSALVYDVVPAHPLGLRPGDRVLGYDGKPWKQLYQDLIAEELPMWPLWWGSGPEGFEHSFVMSAGLNWPLFDTMNIYKQATGQLQNVSTSQMPGSVVSPFCSEQLAVAGIPKPNFANVVSWGVVEGTNIGYIYVWGWFNPAPERFAEAIRDLTQNTKVEGLIIDIRFNVGGFLRGPLTGLAALFDHPKPTIGMDARMRPADHLKMKSAFQPSEFKVDFDRAGIRDKASFGGPIAVLVGPGALSAGDFSALWADVHPKVRTFGKSTAMAAGLPTQPALGTSLDLHPEWIATIAETNSYRVGAPKDYLIHTDLIVDERVWLRPDDVAAGKDTVVEAALHWLGTQTPN